MTVTDSAQEFLSGKLSHVDYERIDSELRDIWQSAQDSDHEMSEAVSRSCVASLVVYSQSNDAEVATSPVLNELAISHPLRAILTIDHPECKQSSIEAWVSARCHLSGDSGTKHICCEQITIKKYGDDPGQLPSVVLPLLVPDLPVFLWWHWPSISSEYIGPFLSSIDSLIVDSNEWKDLSPFKLLSELMADARKAPGLSDLSWLRLHAWRMALASTWQNLAQSCGDEPACALAKVVITTAGGNRVQAALLTAWLSARLNWHKSSADVKKAEFVFESEQGQEIKIYWRQADSTCDLPEGALSEVTLSTTTGKTATLANHEGDGRQMIVLCGDGAEDSGILVARGGSLKLAGLIGAELMQVKRDVVFAETLKKLSTIDELF